MGPVGTPDLESRSLTSFLGRICLTDGLGRTHIYRRDYQSRPTDHWGEVCALGWLPWWDCTIAGLSAQRSTFKTQGRVRRVMVPDKADSYQTIAPKQLLRLGYMRFLPPKPVPGVARTIKMASIDRQCGISGGGLDTAEAVDQLTLYL